MYKRERERLVHMFTHERGSLLAHIFGELKWTLNERERDLKSEPRSLTFVN